MLTEREVTTVLKLIVSFFLVVSLANTAFAEKMVVKRITLASFKTRNDAIIGLPKTSPYWPEVDRHILTVDDSGNIYILNLWNNEILVYNGRGKYLKKVNLRVKLYRERYQNGYLETSGDGKQFYVYGLDQSKHSVQFVFDSSGNVVKKLPFLSFPDVRLCNGTYVFFQGQYVYDQDFNRIEEVYKDNCADSEGKYGHSYNNKLIKFDKNGNIIWQKQFRHFGIVGRDNNGFFYVEGRLKKNDPNTLYKLDSKGNIVAQAPIPKPFPFLTKEEREERDSTASEELPYIFKLACNGDVYLIHQLGELPGRTFNRWLKGGEYFIYKFETVRDK